jgi:C4-type Zn-finger protein
MGFQSRKNTANSMHRCPSCYSILVQPVAFEHRGDDWMVELRCPDCEWRDRDIYSRDEIERYEIELDRGDQELIEDLRALCRANMQEEVERFAASLATDCILPEDFRLPD